MTSPTTWEQVTRTLIECAGDDPSREGLRDTPARFGRAFTEWFDGYGKDPSDLFKVFEDGAENCDELVLVANIPVYSHCEHHLTPFFGLAHIAYLPAEGKILGLSKFARLVDIFAHRLQVQERLTNQIADCLIQHLEPGGVGVLLECRHLCIESRGARVRGTVTTTSALRRALKTKGDTRAEFFSLVHSASQAKLGGGL